MAAAALSESVVIDGLILQVWRKSRLITRCTKVVSVSLFGAIVHSILHQLVLPQLLNSHDFVHQRLPPPPASTSRRLLLWLLDRGVVIILLAAAVGSAVLSALTLAQRRALVRYLRFVVALYRWHAEHYLEENHVVPMTLFAGLPPWLSDQILAEFRDPSFRLNARRRRCVQRLLRRIRCRILLRGSKLSFYAATGSKVKTTDDDHNSATSSSSSSNNGTLDCDTSGASRGMTDQCVICLEKFAEGQMIRVLRSCQHCFHDTCIQNWCSQNPCCPLCRSI